MNRRQFISCLIYICCLLCGTFSTKKSQARSIKNSFSTADSVKNTDILFPDSDPTAKTFRQQLVNIVISEYNRWNIPFVYRENDSLMLTAMQLYWANLGLYVTSKQIQDSLWEELNPWSAAFISWAMMQAGAGTNFKYANNHAAYIEASKNNKGKAGRMFNAYQTTDITAAWPRPGDLLCKNRDGKTYTLNSIKKGCISHCDVVTEVDSVSRIVTTIGGNLNNRVAKRIVFLNEKGLIDPNIIWCITDDPLKEPSGSQADYFAVIKTGEVDFKSGF